jgi:prepilin-type N-terminal cleavage/methylation domain-containing protein
MKTRRTRLGGFSLVELVVVIVIIGIIAAMAIPRLSRGTAGASDSAVAGNLAIVRNAIQLYAAEHSQNFPTQAKFTEHLTMYTSVAGAESATRDATHPFGPYLMAIPPCPVGDQTTPTAVAFDAVNSPPSVTADTGGWIYNPNTGEFLANTNVTDQAGKAYNTY